MIAGLHIRTDRNPDVQRDDDAVLIWLFMDKPGHTLKV